MTPDLVVAHRLRKTFGSVTALDGVELTIRRGEFLAVVGRSGSGKSTLLNVLAGLETPDDGTVDFDGRPLPGDEDALALWRRDHVGLVFQSFHLIATLSALENTALPLFPCRMTGHQRREQARHRLDQVGLGHRLQHRPAQLSGGEQQRVAIARALVGRPQLLLADEPTGNLDSTTSQEILDLFAQIRTDTEVALVVITHDEKVAAAADRQIRLQDGKVAP